MNIADVIEELNGHGFTDTGTPDKLRKINATIYDIASREAWPFLEKRLALTFDGTNAYPSNWPTDHRASLSVVDVTTGRVIQPERIDVVEKTYNTMLYEVGETFVYYFLAGRMNFARIPAAGTSISLRYLSVPTAVTDTTLEASVIVPKQHHEAIVFGALQKLYDQEDDPELSSRFEQHYEQQIQQMRGELLMQQYDRPQRVYVVDEDDWGY